MLKHLAFILILVGGSYYFWNTRPITHGPGEVAPEKPERHRAYGVKPIDHNTYTIVPRTEFEIEARVLSSKRYYNDRKSEIAPYDFVVGWGPMSDERNLDHILITQSDRSFEWQMTKPPIPLHKMAEYTMNLHLVPSNYEIGDQLGQIRPGNIISIKGYLVKVESAQGWSFDGKVYHEKMGDKKSKVIWIKEFSFR